MPDGPYFACTVTPFAASNAFATSVSAPRSEPAAWSSTGSAACADDIMSQTNAIAASDRITRPDAVAFGKNSCSPLIL